MDEPKKRGAGRRKLNENELKVRVTFRVLPAQRKEIEEKAKLYTGGNLSEYINSQLFYNKNKVVIKENTADRKELYTMIREINKQGNNLNQLTRLGNQGRFIDDSLKPLLEKIIKTNNEINDNLIFMLSNDS